MDNTSKGNFTKMGFSKAGFSCCSYYANCAMGSKECHYFLNGSDLEAKDHCNCYQRHHSTRQAVPVPDVQELKQEEIQSSFEWTDELEQLSLFE